MGRILVIAGLAILAGCDEDYFEDVVTVSVVNQGSEEVFGRAEDWDFSLSPGASTSFEVWVEKRLTVHVWRTSDSLLLFADTWKPKELEQLGERVTVTLAP